MKERECRVFWCQGVCRVSSVLGQYGYRRSNRRPLFRPPEPPCGCRPSTPCLNWRSNSLPLWSDKSGSSITKRRSSACSIIHSSLTWQVQRGAGLQLHRSVDPTPAGRAETQTFFFFFFGRLMCRMKSIFQRCYSIIGAITLIPQGICIPTSIRDC